MTHSHWQATPRRNDGFCGKGTIFGWRMSEAVVSGTLDAPAALCLVDKPCGIESLKCHGNHQNAAGLRCGVLFTIHPAVLAGALSGKSTESTTSFARNHPSYSTGNQCSKAIPDMNTETGIDIVELRKMIADSFDRSELSTLCFDLGIEFDNLSGDTVDAKSRELVKHCHKSGMLDRLIAECQSHRPNAQWQTKFSIVNSVKDITTDDGRNTDRLYALVLAYNKTMSTPKSPGRTSAADDIAYSIRELAPNLTGLFDIRAWLKSYNPGKRLAAIMYLDWNKDIEFVPDLLLLLPSERFFIQYHILGVMSGMMNQFDEKIRGHVVDQLAMFDPKDDKGVDYYKQHILETLSTLARL